MAANVRIESLLSARSFQDPQVVGSRVYFISNLSGHLSLYAMDRGGSVPEPILPPDVVLHNPRLVGGYPYYVFPKLGQILVMLDHHGDENYQPMLVPIEGGYPEPIFQELADHRVHMGEPDVKRNLVYLVAESRKEQMNYGYQADLRRRKLRKLGQSMWGSYPETASESHAKVVLTDGYTAGDVALYLWEKGASERRLVYGKPIEQRAEGEVVPPTGIHSCQFVAEDRALLFVTYQHDDAGGLGRLELASPSVVAAVPIRGTVHTGRGMLEGLEHLDGDRYAVTYSIDGVSWIYEGAYDGTANEMHLDRVVCGQGELANGVVDSHRYDKARKRWAISFATATAPTQLYLVEKDGKVHRQTSERVLGIPAEWLSSGEDASYTSFDGTRVSARMYRPAPALGFEGARPLVYYVHGGPQSQERPDFAWFSMPLIQFLTMNGFAVFVPNVRGSSGYGLSYMKQVDRDWGGKDRLDHVHAITEVLPKDPGIDVRRAAVTGRSYGGYMTLVLAAQHPDLWAAACDMFGPYDLVTFMERIPETWKPYFRVAVGDPEKDRAFLAERSPRTYIDQVRCPLLVVQGKNDPRVVERESRDVVEALRAKGKDIEYLMFEDEGHDVLKFPNRVRCYNAITEFFRKHLRP